MLQRNLYLTLISDLTMKKRVLVVVTHPDDETLWMGGTLIRNKDKWNTTLICLTRKSDKDRYPKFKKVMKEFGVEAFIYDLDDTNYEIPLNQNEIINIISKHTKDKFDYVFTHNNDGEYGNTKHIETHNAVIQAIKNKTIKTKKCFLFSYKKIENDFQGYAVPKLNSDILIKLNNSEISMKRRLAVDVYGYDRGGKGFEELSVSPIEAFMKLK